MNSTSLPTKNHKKRKHKRVTFKPNRDGILALIALVLVIAVVVTAVVFLSKLIIYSVNESKETNQSGDTLPGDNNNPVTTPWNNAYINTPYANSNISVGDLILVNSNNTYAFVDSIKDKNTTNLYKYEGHGSYYVLPGSDTRVHSSMISSLKQMIFDMVDTNETLGTTSSSDRIFITGAYRDTTLQTTLNTNNPSLYPEAPGYSEHHTGLAVDIKVLSDSATVQLRDNEYMWLESNCTKYGFVLRYDGSKMNLTGIADEPYHLRYVGVPHATYMTENNLCLEEYLELLRTSHKYEDAPLEIAAGDKEYLVYYVAANTAEGSNFTSIPVPPASEGTYTISGDNMNGFVVTVEKTAQTGN